MSSNNGSVSQELIKVGFQSRKPRMSVVKPREVFHFRIPEPEEYVQMEDEEEDGYGDEYPCDASSIEGNNTIPPYHPFEYDEYYEYSDPQSDACNQSLHDSSSTHHQDHVQKEHGCHQPVECELMDEDDNGEISDFGSSSPSYSAQEPDDECELMPEDDYGDISVSDEFSSHGSSMEGTTSPQYDYDSSSDVEPICDSFHSHESDYGYETYSPQSDDSSSTHDRDYEQDHESYKLEGSSSPEEPLSPPRCAAYFDCKLCLKMAREPVATSCGHLYCGDCLDKWLHFFTSQMDCPVGHTKVFDSAITTIRPTVACNRDFPSGCTPVCSTIRLTVACNRDFPPGSTPVCSTIRPTVVCSRDFPCDCTPVR